MEKSQDIAALKKRIEALEQENAMLRRDFTLISNTNTVSVPEEIKPLFDKAQIVVGDYFRNLKMDPNKGTIEINDQRYVLVRASALSTDFLSTIQKLYADRGDKEALAIGKNFLFDIAHVIGVNDAVNFHTKMNLTDPIAKLSAGPVHFAYSGWAYVDILPDSTPSPDENFCLIYNHPFSFEADSWIRSGKKSDSAVCIMNAGYSSGWCEQSFGMQLTSVEVTCKAKGDDKCTFIMSPPHKIQEHLNRFHAGAATINEKMSYDIPTFFERKKVEEEMQIARLKAEESDKSKSEFLANMSHEIRTPMNAIMGYVDLILKDNLDTDHREYLETVRESGQMLLALINDVLDLSKIEAGQLVVENSACSLKELFRQVEHLGNGLINSSSNSVDLSITIDTSISDEVLLDSIRLQQVLNNLVSNAIKFTSKGRVECGVKLLDKQLLFYVKDSGIGIATKDFDKIFKMFGQADASTTRKFGGSGLGLTISKKIIDLLGGKMWVESELGKGSNFYFTILYNPIFKEKALAAEIDSISQEKELLLLVEDNLINQRLTKLILEKSGYAVLTANNGQVAVDLFKSNPKIKLIIMDIQMPVLDGLSATKEIRTLEFENKLSKIPIIALTAHAMKGDKEKCIEAGCDNYLSKPILIELLINTIKKYI